MGKSLSDSGRTKGTPDQGKVESGASREAVDKYCGQKKTRECGS
ncbi:hypothetical protein [Pseudomonas sp. WPR_5_2]|nr:hypothetical protein [Pseudomonas sp. WPR_5_2]